MDPRIIAAIRECFAQRKAKEYRGRATKLELSLQRLIQKAISLWPEWQIRYSRQYVIKGFIPDFAIPSLKILLEADGPHHDYPYQREHDRRKDTILSKDGYLILRFTVKDLANEKDCVRRINLAIKARLDARATLKT